MRVLVIGGSEFIGGALVRRLREVGVAPGSRAPGFDYAHDLVAETSRIRRELGFRERASADEAMRRTVEDARVVR